MHLLDAILRPHCPVLRGERVLLRLPKRSDYVKWAALRGESAPFLRPWEPEWSRDELSVHAFRSRLRRYYSEAHSHSSFTFFIFDMNEDVLMGGLTLSHIRRGVAQVATLGYWMGERFAGQGLMREAVREVTRFAFDVENLHRVEAACLPANERSIGLLTRCGFTHEGLLRRYLRIAGEWEDHSLYSLLAEEWPRSGAMDGRREHGLGVQSTSCCFHEPDR
ncbi:ribosomal-protein-alanine N-acetyltransferase [Fulvimarina pelagi HTCC2506]|uniref:Ribosomal-protein-alanine N-acetyltransferase n=2 Tax=Fulvimarina pelagi TaxID=217511 RepID=Q0G176_9HYPH|nr:GNAT family protein [Fulvimarina pelagi]EAU41205.1 ribosomal-protein-alanine N-acetyltransferase [Fulvimarina pelagi HTCC2506]BAT30784.1 ribosomal-protein-alanine N-acetyltransferase [Fulvimarina pelagi]